MKDSSLYNFLISFFDAFPDIHYTIEQIVCEGDIVAVNLAATGTHKKIFNGYAPTNKTVSYREMFFFQNGEGENRGRMALVLIRAW